MFPYTRKHWFVILVCNIWFVKISQQKCVKSNVPFEDMATSATVA